MSKQDAEIYRKAAEMIYANFEDGPVGSCEAIAHFDRDGLLGLAVRKYERLFRPEVPNLYRDYWGQLWGVSLEEIRACRVLALCFAAAMAEAGDL